MQQFLADLKEKKNVRESLRGLIDEIKGNPAESKEVLAALSKDAWCELLDDEDAKSRKNAATLLSLLPWSHADAADVAEALFSTYKKEETLFVSCEGEKMTRQGFWKLIRKYGKDAGLESELTPHMLRHSYAVNALRKGEDVHELQAILGHKDLNSTIEYSHLV